jgi:hypothetical protein
MAPGDEESVETGMGCWKGVRVTSELHSMNKKRGRGVRSQFWDFSPFALAQPGVVWLKLSSKILL